MISEAQLKTMLQMQDTLNQKIHPEWRSQKFAWHRAIMAEGVELLEHIGWKWWKKQTPDIAQAKIELVDIWHFAMSLLMTRSTSLDDVVASLQTQMRISAGYPVKMMPNIECLIGAASLHLSFEAAAFFGLMKQMGMTGDELYTTYIAKNVLNTFRQDHGYKDGTYIKTWAGVEDNVALERLMVQSPAATPEQLTEQLDKLYACVVAEAS